MTPPLLCLLGYLLTVLTGRVAEPSRCPTLGTFVAGTPRPVFFLGGNCGAERLPSYLQDRPAR